MLRVIICCRRFYWKVTSSNRVHKFQSGQTQGFDENRSFYLSKDVDPAGGTLVYSTSPGGSGENGFYSLENLSNKRG